MGASQQTTNDDRMNERTNEGKNVKCNVHVIWSSLFDVFLRFYVFDIKSN